MDDSLFARLGYDPVRIFTVFNGGPPSPGGIVRLNPRAGPADAPAEAPAPAPAPPPGEPPPRVEDGEEGLPHEAPPHVAPPEKSPADRAAPAGSEARSAEPQPAEPDPSLSDRIRLIRGWIDEHWTAIEAMAHAGEAPQRPAPPPLEPAGPPPPPPPVHVRRGDRWNKSKMVDFLRQLAATQSVAAAARSVGMSRNSAYRLRNRLKGQPFDVAWEAAFRHGYDNLAHAALDRAINGVEVPHYCNGELVGTSRRYDERLTVAMLAMRNRAGAPTLGRYGAAAEYWGERWDQLLERIASGAVDWGDEHRALGEEERNRLDLPDAERELALLIARNTPDDRGGGASK